MHFSLYLSSCYCPIAISALLLCTLFLFAGEGHFTPLNMASVELHKFGPLPPPMNKLLCSPHSSTTLLHLWGPLPTAMYDILLNSTSLARLLLHEPGVVLSTLHYHIADLMRSTFNHHYSILLNSTSWSSCSSMNQPWCSPLSTTTLLMLWGSLSTTTIASFRTPQGCPTATPWTSRSALYSPLPLFWSFGGHFHHHV